MISHAEMQRISANEIYTGFMIQVISRNPSSWVLLVCTHGVPFAY